jgi:hypothetical protein
MGETSRFNSLTVTHHSLFDRWLKVLGLEKVSGNFFDITGIRKGVRNLFDPMVAEFLPYA